MLYSGLSIAIPRLIALVTRVVYIVPSVTAVQYLGVACYPGTEASSIEVHSVFTFFNIAFGNVAPLLVSTLIPACCLHYIKKHSITGEPGYNKAISRLALFLITGSAVNLAGSLLIVACAFTSYASASVYLLYGFGVLTLLPTPIFIIMFLKVVQEHMKAIMACHCSHSHQVQPLP